MNKEQPVTMTLQELDNTIFTHLTAAMARQFPTEHRTALKVAMLVADGAMLEFEALAKRQSKSRAASQAAEARWVGAGSITTATPTVGDIGLAATNAAPTVSKKRHRRTKAEIAAANAALAQGAQGPIIPVPPYSPPSVNDLAHAPTVNDFGVAVAAPTDPALAAAIAAASGSPVNTPTEIPPPPPLQIPTFGAPSV